VALKRLAAATASAVMQVRPKVPVRQPLSNGTVMLVSGKEFMGKGN